MLQTSAFLYLCPHKSNKQQQQQQHQAKSTSWMCIVRSYGTDSDPGPKLQGWITPVVLFSNPSFGPGALHWWVAVSATPKRATPLPPLNKKQNPNGAKRPKNSLKQPRTILDRVQGGPTRSITFWGQPGTHGAPLGHRTPRYAPYTAHLAPFWAI